jgi:hypothetical protein
MEVRNIARTLRLDGKPAFFVRIEHVTPDFEDAFALPAPAQSDLEMTDRSETQGSIDQTGLLRLRRMGGEPQ